MDCSKVHNDLIFYLEGSLSGESKESVEEHLRKCEDCSAFAAMLKSSLDIIEQEKATTAGEDFADRVIAGMCQGQTRTIGLFTYVRYAAAAAAVILGIFTGLNIARVTTSPPDTMPGEPADEVYYLNDMYQEPIESFFLLKYSDDE